MRQRITIQARGREYPALDPGYYDLSPEQQTTYLDALDDRDNREQGETTFDRTALALTDVAAAQGKKVTQLERLVESLVGEVRELRQELSQRDQALEIKKADSLVEAESKLAQTVVSAAAVEASLRNQTAASQAEMERQQADHRGRMEATERVVSDQEGRLKSSGQLFQERGNALQDQLATAEGRQTKVGDLLLEELEGRTDALNLPDPQFIPVPGRG